jgi:RNA polymerase sigma-70 factor (sigma-E family)
MMASMALDDEVGDLGPEQAVADLFREHYRSLVRLAALLLGDREASEEVVQDAFVKLQLGWHRVRDHERTPAWLRSAVLNGARSRLRHRRVRDGHRGAPMSVVTSAEAGALAADEHHRMVAALRMLPARQREALALKFYMDLTEAEIAAAMGVAAGSVKTHVHRGLAALHSALGAEEEQR